MPISCISEFMRVDQFPVHLQRELKRMQDREDSERRQQEMERNTCKVSRNMFKQTGPSTSYFYVLR